MNRPLTIYIASSFRNVHAVRMLSDRLRAEGHTILDWTVKAPPLPEDMPVEERRALLDADERGDIFRFCAHACARADLIIYIGPAGQDAACEVGMAYTSGVPVYGLRGMLEAPGLILSKAVSRWFDNEADLLAALYDDQPDEAGLGEYNGVPHRKIHGLKAITLKLWRVAEAADAVMRHLAGARYNQDDFCKLKDAMERLRLALLDTGYGGGHEQDEN